MLSLEETIHKLLAKRAALQPETESVIRSEIEKAGKATPSRKAAAPSPAVCRPQTNDSRGKGHWFSNR